ncbi:glutathione S-transferase [Coniella lustricola]|uniref:Glutathione S-transferase n=1 Tax=Coniella lustricola TaxID=2025994 RepID=A0A2T2ZWU5_9PEZI|nr:glutathione S-transferase [Coniella lustricola]
MASQHEPTGLIATSGLELLTAGTPNGWKITALLEELKAHYGTSSTTSTGSTGSTGFPQVTYQPIDIMQNTQKQPWFTALNPNGRIPVLVDHARGGFAVFEGSAILAYLARHYDPDHVFSFPADTDDFSVAEQWIAWQHGGLGPMQGQANHFFRFAKEKIPYPIQRYVGESERLYGILDARLRDRDYVAGPGRGKYSIADIAMLGWANIALLSGVNLDALFPNVVAWLDRCLARPATKAGFAIPAVSSFSNDALRAKIRDDPEEKRKADESTKLLEDAKAQYNYKYTSP